MSDIKQEKSINDQPIPVPIDGMKTICSQMKNCICIIYQEDGRKGTGFFCKIPFQNDKLPVLITNNHVLDEKDIENGKIIKLMINDKPKKIEMDKSRNKFTKYDKNIDITIIEIKPNEDGIGIDNCLELDEEKPDFIYKNKSIYILHYPNEKRYASFGIINKIKDNKKIEHKCNTIEGSSGSPILSLETFKVIGIHCGCYSDTIKLNVGTFIKYAIDIFNNFKSNIKNILVKNPIVTYYRKKTETNLQKISDKINSKENASRFGQIQYINKYGNNIMKDKENTLSNNNNQNKSKSLGKKNESNNKLDSKSRRNSNIRNCNKIEDNFNILNRRGSLDLDDKKGNKIISTEMNSPKAKYSNSKEKKKKSNFKMSKENNEINFPSSRNLKNENQLNKDRTPLI